MTPAAGLLLITCALLAAPAGAEDPAALAEAALERAVKLPAEKQQVWLSLIEQRYAWAVLITMKPDDARRERDRVAGILHQKTVAWNDMAALLRQLDQREKAAVSHLVRVYREDVYKNFGQRQQELVHRQEAWYRVWSAWEKAGSLPEQQDRLMDWLAAAIKASSQGTLGRLPADPRFSSDEELVSEASVKRWREERDRRRSLAAGPGRVPETAEPRPEIPVRGPLALRVPDPQWGLERLNKAAETTVAREVDAPPTRSAGAPASGSPALAISPTLWRARQTRSTEPSSGNGTDDLTSRPAARRDAAMASDCKASGAAGLMQSPLAGDHGGLVHPLALGGTRPPAELPPHRAVGPTVEPPAVAQTPPPARRSGVPPIELMRRDATSTVAADSDTRRESSPPRDALVMLPRQALQSAVPGMEGPAAYSAQRRPVQPDFAPHNRDDQHAQVNLEELRMRIEGVNLSLRTLEGELDEKRELTTDQLDSLLSRLDILVLRQKDLALFRGLITPQEQARVGQIDSSRAAVATLGTRIAELRSRVCQNQSLRDADRAAALKRFDELSDRLATLTAGK